MRIKKAFTLAEILIVLTVIGVLATMTVPTMTKSMDEAANKTAYKKAYSVVSNVFGILKAEGKFPATKSKQSAMDLFDGLVSNMEVDGYVDNTLGTNTRIKTTSADRPAYNGDKESQWIVSSDNIAYKVIGLGTTNTCDTKQSLNTKNNTSIKNSSCVVVAIDANGLSKSPNILEPQMEASTINSSSSKANPFTGDRFYIYIGSDGVAKGNGATSLSGRMLHDEK